MYWRFISDASQFMSKNMDASLLIKLWDKGWTPINIDILLKYLLEYKNRVDAELLSDGFINGFQ